MVEFNEEELNAVVAKLTGAIKGLDWAKAMFCLEWVIRLVIEAEFKDEKGQDETADVVADHIKRCFRLDREIAKEEAELQARGPIN